MELRDRAAHVRDAYFISADQFINPVRRMEACIRQETLEYQKVAPNRPLAGSHLDRVFGSRVPICGPENEMTRMGAESPDFVGAGDRLIREIQNNGKSDEEGHEEAESPAYQGH